MIPVIVATVVFLIIFLSKYIRIVQQYETAIVFRLGRFVRTLNPGLNFIIPFIEWTTYVDMRIVTLDIPKQQVITKDNVPATINGVTYFKVMDASIAIIKVQNYSYAVSQYAQAALRDVVGGMTLDELLAERQKIGDEIEKIVAQRSKDWGLEVTDIRIQDVDMPEDFEKDDVPPGLSRKRKARYHY